MMLTLNPRAMPWHPPVLRAVATSGQGLGEIRAAIDAHRAEQETTGALPERRRRRRRDEILRLVERRAAKKALDAAARSGRLDDLAAQVAAGTIDPYAAAEEILKAEDPR
jgi:LAO/AO transport system kinase